MRPDREEGGGHGREGEEAVEVVARLGFADAQLNGRGRLAGGLSCKIRYRILLRFSAK